MKTRILYTTRNQKAILEENRLHENNSYLKHIYEDEVLKKTELWIREQLDSITLYPDREEKASDEEILLAHAFLRSVRIIRIENTGAYQFVRDRQYKNFLFSKEEIYLSDFDSRKIASYTVTQYGTEQKKYIHLKDGGYREFTYSDGRKPYLREESFIKNISEVLTENNSSVSPDYYLEFSPFFPSGEELKQKTVRYFSFYEEKEITFQEAFFEREFIKKVYIQDQLQRIDTFKRLKMNQREYFIDDHQPFKRSKEDLNYLIDVHYLREEKNGFKKWEIIRYKKNETEVDEREIWVMDAQGKRIFYRELDGSTGNTILTRKFPHFPGSVSSLSTCFEYNAEGKLTTEGVDLYDDWDGDYYSVDQMHQDGFFESEYGRYFVSADPEIQEVSQPLTVTVYKNHLDEEIPEKDIKGLYEYSEETYERKRLIRRRKYTAYSGKDLKEQKYITLTSSYDDDMKEVPDLETSHDNSDRIYYNRRTVNHYILYDFITRDYWEGRNAEFSGTVVYDNYYRTVSEIVYDAASEQLISGSKTLYGQVSPLLGRKYITVNFNRDGQVESYTDNRFIFPEHHSKEKFDNKHFGSGPLSQDYYKNLKDLVPENPAFPYYDFTISKMLYGNETGTESEMTLLISDSKIKIVAEEYVTYHFLSNEESLEDYLRAVPDLGVRSQMYFYNTSKQKNMIETDFSGLGIKARFSIDLNTREIDCHSIESSVKDVSFRKAVSGKATDLYLFYTGERKIFVNFYSELLIDLLLKA
ncbi:hypothetical protein [Chryseobacterium arthrosphaerae]|uniref:hypothetical protein n=1 Tax=Chryseobacterium arthrosphaerae TaxID=651561 RepID=UPI00241E41B6|nr:hypothetical protein [Chryseobacterium arthrosphaerae]